MSQYYVKPLLYPSTTLPIKTLSPLVPAASGHADRTNPSDPDEYGIKGSDLFHDFVPM